MRYPLIAVLLLAACGTAPPPEIPTQIADHRPEAPVETLDPGVYYPPATTHYALQLSSYLSEHQAVMAWQNLTETFQTLKALQPMIMKVRQDGQPWIRLLAGLLEDEADAAWICARLIENRHYCRPVRVDETEPPQVAEATPGP